MDSCTTPERTEVRAEPFRTIQLHPTRKCNLACLHCYSSSAPDRKEMLDIGALKHFLSYAYDQGFNNLSLSGGEPFLYKDLEILLEYSHAIGYQNTVASNGMLLQSERNKRILEHVDLIAVSIDGPQPVHDYIRGQEGAFEKMLQGVEVIKSLKKPFGFIHTITPQSWEHLLWLGRFAQESGAGLLQLHPLEMYGRALEALPGHRLDDTLYHRAYILANYLNSKYGDRMVVQLDLLHRDYLESFPQVVHSFTRTCSAGGRLSDLFDTIVVEETGRIIPIAYGFNDLFSIGNVHNFDDTLFERFTEHHTATLRQLYDTTLQKILNNRQTDIINWTELLINESKMAS